ncbi:hypothetical protein KDA_16220 [Dictyobacter alpinus]|uniref:Glycosyltransferase RgtA/B/C/D-like domain-containing protein n=1 Tax=Dictyobacter alpinus TaxID=2014873 RepID=A0A402B468_9CHLR|nr:mannosyltransferase family protein [Dictyobacter alpinus]GCE26138.1 hypothetical protein KDA_16220 [Dictyobacter alpinus]
MKAQDITTEQTEASKPISLAGVWRSALDPWRKAALAALPTFLLTRLLLLVLTYFGGILFNAQGASSFAFTANSILYNWYHWDAIRTLAIATRGYVDPSYTAIFPLYPVIIHTFSAPLHIDILLAAMLISNLAFFAALMVLYLLVEAEFDAGTARRALLYLAVFPTALFFFMAYNSALLLLFTLLCLYFLRRGSWWLAGLAGALATLTDLFGCILFVVFLCEFFRQQGPELRKQENLAEKRERILKLLPLVAALFIPLGLIIYSLALQKPFHNPLVFLHPQEANNNVSLGGLFTALHILTSGSWLTYAAAHALFELLILSGMLLLLFMGWKGRERLAAGQWPWLVFGTLAILYAILLPNQPGLPANQFDPLPSVQYVALLFIPGLLVLARLGRYPWLHQTYLLFATPMLAFLVFQLFKILWAM